MEELKPPLVQKIYTVREIERERCVCNIRGGWNDGRTSSVKCVMNSIHSMIGEGIFLQSREPKEKKEGKCIFVTFVL